MLRNLAIKVVVTTIVFCSTAVSHSALQYQRTKPLPPAIYNGNSNEDAKLGLDDTAATAGENKLIIMIARLGNKESSRNLSRRRLQTARDYLKYTRSIAEQRIVTAEGEPVNGQGRVEVYIGGNLHMIFMMGRNKNFAPEP